MKVLVTGGAGFIGRYVVEELQSRGHTPIIFDRRRTLEHGHQAIYGDVRDATHVTEAMARVEGFIHLAAVLGTQETIQNPIPAAETNLLGGLNVLQAAAQYEVPGVYIGVGNWWMDNSYSITKTMIERFINMYNAERGTRINVVRAMNAYGPRQVAAPPYGPAKVRKITPSFVCRALANHPIEIYGDGSQVSDMIYVADVATALVNALEIDKKVPVVEVGPKEHTTVKQFAELIKEIAGSKSEIIHLPMRPGEIPNASVTADVSTLNYIEMDVELLTPLTVGVRKTIQWFMEPLSAL